MLISHIPASYLMTKSIQKRFQNSRYLWLGILAGTFPDIDLIWFYFIDDRQYLHHSYWVHIPFYWLVLLALCIVAYFSYFRKFSQARFILILFFTNWLLHLMLDTIVGEIKWLYPFSQQRFVLFEVPASYDWWLWSFVFHWSFLLEIGIIGIAAYVLAKEVFGKKIR